MSTHRDDKRLAIEISNKIAFALTPSNEAMNAVRLLIKEVSALIATIRQEEQSERTFLEMRIEQVVDRHYRYSGDKRPQLSVNKVLNEIIDALTSRKPKCDKDRVVPITTTNST